MKFENFYEHLRAGGVIAYPTETLWGLGADIYDDDALEKIFEVKGRDAAKAVSVLVRDVNEAKKIAEIDHDIERLLYLFWPGPVTAVLPAKAHVSKAVTGGRSSVGIRCSSHPLIREFLRGYENPITTTSANRSGEPAALSSAELSWLPKEVLCFPEEVLKPSPGSTVLSFEDGRRVRVLREGAVKTDLVAEILAKFGFGLIGQS